MRRIQKQGLTDPDEVIREFQRRQKQVVVAVFISFALMIPLAIYARTLYPILAIITLLVFILPLLGFYLWRFRCPACGVRVQQRRRMLRMSIRCGACGMILDPS